MIGMQQLKPVLLIALRYVFGAALIWWLYRSNLINLDVLQRVQPEAAAAATFLVVLQLFLAGLRVQILLAQHGITVGILRCISYNSLGIFYSLFLPGGMSGDLARAYCFWRSYPEASKSALFGALFIDRLLGTVAMLVMGLVGGVFLMNTLGLTRFVIVTWLAFTVAVIGYLLVIRLHRKADKTQSGLVGRVLRFVEKIDLQGYSSGILVKSTLLSFAGHICAVLIIYMFSQILDSGLDLLKITTVAPLGLLANALPLTPGGLGIGEKGFELLYNMVGGTNGGNSFLISRVFLFAPALLGGIVVLMQFIKAHEDFFQRFRKET